MTSNGNSSTLVEDTLTGFCIGIRCITFQRLRGGGKERECVCMCVCRICGWTMFDIVVRAMWGGMWQPPTSVEQIALISTLSPRYQVSLYVWVSKCPRDSASAYLYVWDNTAVQDEWAYFHNNDSVLQMCSLNPALQNDALTQHNQLKIVRAQVTMGGGGHPTNDADGVVWCFLLYKRARVCLYMH